MSSSSALQLTLSTLGQLQHGAAEIAVNNCLSLAIRDIEDRGDEDEKERVVEIKVRFNKRPSGQIEAELEVGAKLPAYRTAPTACATKQVAGLPTLFFQSNSPDNPDQNELPIDDDEHQKGK